MYLFCTSESQLTPFRVNKVKIHVFKANPSSYAFRNFFLNVKVNYPANDCVFTFFLLQNMQ